MNPGELKDKENKSSGPRGMGDVMKDILKLLEGMDVDYGIHVLENCIAQIEGQKKKIKIKAELLNLSTHKPVK